MKKYIILVILIQLAWGAGFPISKVAMDYFTPLFFIFLRLITNALFLLPFTKIKGQPIFKLFVLACIWGFLQYAFVYWGLSEIDASTTALLMQMQAPFGAILAAIFFKDYIGWKRSIGIALSFIGLLFIVGTPILSGDLLAILSVLTGVMFFAVGSVYAKSIKNVDATTINFFIGLFAAPQVLLASLIFEDGQLQSLLNVQWPGIAALLYMVLAVTIFGYGLWYKLLQKHDVNDIMPYTILQPFFGVIISILFLSEEITLNTMIGILIMLSGVAIIMKRTKTKEMVILQEHS